MALGTIPNDVRVPLVYIEIDNSQALSGNIAQDQNVMLFGQMTDAGGDAGTATPLQVVEVPVSESAIDSLFGVGSMMALAAKRYRKANSYTRTFALPVGDLTAGAAAVGSFTFAGPATQAGTLYLLIAGQPLQVGVAAAATAAKRAAETCRVRVRSRPRPSSHRVGIAAGLRPEIGARSRSATPHRHTGTLPRSTGGRRLSPRRPPVPRGSTARGLAAPARHCAAATTSGADRAGGPTAPASRKSPSRPVPSRLPAARLALDLVLSS